MSLDNELEEMQRAWEDTDALLRKYGSPSPSEDQLVRYWADFVKDEFGSEDKFVFEMRFPYGRADIVVFHVDGSASVIEAKDGANGYTYVVAGIGQASLYAAQLGMSTGAPRKVRKCLLWTSTGDAAKDEAIKGACRIADTKPICIGSAKELMAIWLQYHELGCFLKQMAQGAKDVPA